MPKLINLAGLVLLAAAVTAAQPSSVPLPPPVAAAPAATTNASAPPLPPPNGTQVSCDCVAAACSDATRPRLSGLETHRPVPLKVDLYCARSALPIPITVPPGARREGEERVLGRRLRAVQGRAAVRLRGLQS
jgi:hypothetical protein